MSKGLLRRDDGGIGHQGEVDSGVGYQVSLELIQIHIQGSIKPQGGSDGGDNLADEAVQVGVRRSVNIQVPPADVIDGLIIHHEGAVRVLQCSVGTQGGVVGLNHSSGNLKKNFFINNCFVHIPESRALDNFL